MRFRCILGIILVSFEVHFGVIFLNFGAPAAFQKRVFYMGKTHFFQFEGDWIQHLCHASSGVPFQIVFSHIFGGIGEIPGSTTCPKWHLFDCPESILAPLMTTGVPLCVRMVVLVGSSVWRSGSGGPKVCFFVVPGRTRWYILVSFESILAPFRGWMTQCNSEVCGGLKVQFLLFCPHVAQWNSAFFSDINIWNLEHFCVLKLATARSRANYQPAGVIWETDASAAEMVILLFGKCAKLQKQESPFSVQRCSYSGKVQAARRAARSCSIQTERYRSCIRQTCNRRW